MQEAEVILVNEVPEHHYRQVVEKAIRYALLSIPFTYNRMTLDRLEQRIRNIAKGKTAEYIFRLFCWKNDIPADFETCTTPFYQPDKRDFLLGTAEWDIKNNFVYHTGDSLAEDQYYTSLPALVPCSYEGDQWDKREQLCFEASGELRFLFTFLKNADEHGSRESFFDLKLETHQWQHLAEICREYEDNHSPAEEPFAEETFFQRLGFSPEHFCIHHFPHLVITGWAGTEHWKLFSQSGDGKHVYGNGILKTRINNAWVPVKALPSFLSLYPHLQRELHMAVLRQ